MKKIHLILLAFSTLLIFTEDVFSQAFDDGANIVYLGFGVPPNERIKKDFSNKYANYTNYKFNNYGTGVLKYEHGLHKHFGLGLNMEYSASSAKYQYGLSSTSVLYDREIKNNIIGGYVRFNAHLPLVEKLDIYGGVGLGYLYTKNLYTDTNPSSFTNTSNKETYFEFDYQFTAGIRFMVKERTGLFVEFGYATTPAQIGIAFKF